MNHGIVTNRRALRAPLLLAVGALALAGCRDDGADPVGPGGAAPRPAWVAGSVGAYDYAASGLPAPRSAGSYVNGVYVKGYDELVSQVRGSAKASWAARSLLEGERAFQDRGGTMKRYLSTAWVWFENSASGWPDPYEINCNDSLYWYGTPTEVSAFCGYENHQVAGYQAYARRGDYVRMFRMFWSDAQLPAVLKTVADNGANAIRPQWNYRDPGQNKGLVARYLPGISGATIADISPSTGFLTERTQFHTLLLGKHPNMVAALNSFAVSDGDLVYALKYSSCAYGYICADGKQTLSNMVAALIVLEGSPTSGGVTARTACEGGYCGPYNLRAGPGTGYEVTGSVNGGVSVTIVCQTYGTSHTGPWGATTVWDKLGGAYAGKWISDAYVYTGSSGLVAPRC